MAYSRELFNRWIPGLFQREGGFNANVGGTGEYVNRGLRRASYPNEDIKGMTEQRAKDLYYRDYWSKLPSGLSDQGAGIYFDALVHSGAGGAGRSFRSFNDPQAMIDDRRGFLDRLSNSPKHAQFKGGWDKRIDNLERDIMGNSGTGSVIGSGPIDLYNAPTSPLEYQDSSPQQAEPLQAAYERGRKQEADSKNDWEKFQQYADNASLQELMARQQQLGAFGKNWGAGQ